MKTPSPEYATRSVSPVIGNPKKGKSPLKCRPVKVAKTEIAAAKMRWLRTLSVRSSDSMNTGEPQIFSTDSFRAFSSSVMAAHALPLRNSRKRLCDEWSSLPRSLHKFWYLERDVGSMKIAAALGKSVLRRPGATLRATQRELSRR
jgi:hypothetical protein